MIEKEMTVDVIGKVGDYEVLKFTSYDPPREIIRVLNKDGRVVHSSNVWKHHAEKDALYWVTNYSHSLQNSITGTEDEVKELQEDIKRWKSELLDVSNTLTATKEVRGENN